MMESSGNEYHYANYYTEIEYVTRITLRSNERYLVLSRLLSNTGKRSYDFRIVDRGTITPIGIILSEHTTRKLSMFLIDYFMQMDGKTELEIKSHSFEQ